MRHRPIGIGVQGLADAFMALRLPFDSPEARKLNLQIFETIYHAAIESSCDMARDFALANPGEDGWYPSYKKNGGSPASRGDLQYDLWGVTPTELWDWAELKAKIAVHGLRNSLVCAPMPTASTSQILGFNECFEPYTSCVLSLPLFECSLTLAECRNIYTRRVLAGEFQIVNPWLLRDLVDRGLWDDAMKNTIIAHNGSIQNGAPSLRFVCPPRLEADGVCSLGHPDRAQGDLQDRLGDFAEDHHRLVCRPSASVSLVLSQWR